MKIYSEYTKRKNMSDSRRNRRQNREPRRPIILAKKEEKNDTPKILLKPKENEKEKKTASPQISIAARPSHSDANQNPINNVSIEHRNQPSKIASAFRDSKDSQQPSKEPQIQIAHIPQTILPQMNRSIPIISDHYQMPNLIQDYLIETNVDFFVVGCVGPLGSGKSSILNFLIDNNLEEYDGDIQTINDILKGKNGIFRTRSSGDAVFSNMPSTEGIQAYITKHRTIFLDCSPVLCNPYKKDGILNELDDLKMLIFLLSICNLLIVVDDSGFNMHLMRLIQMAENMKVDLFEKDLNDFRFSPNILICKNKCQNRDFLAESQQRSIQLYKGFFNGSNLKLTIPYANRKSDYSIVWNDDEPLNIFYFPMINDKKQNLYEAYPDLEMLLVIFRQRVFMSPRHAFSLQSQQPNPFTEKTWFHLALAVWDSHKNNYFLRKYESFKEKEWALRV